MAITTKWPAARLRGPDVPVDDALEYIRRTDPFLVGEGFTNDRAFEASYRRLAGLPEDRFGGGDGGESDWQARWKRQERFKEAFGHVGLAHLGSAWVASSYIGGPHGPVSPSGRVTLAVNFGKWPGEAGIESDLAAVAEAFPWLAFDLSVRGRSEEEDEGLPSNSWHVEAGRWEAIEPKALQVSAPDVATDFLRNINNPHRETTWTVAGIEAMWGDRIRAARAAAGRR